MLTRPARCLIKLVQLPLHPSTTLPQPRRHYHRHHHDNYHHHHHDNSHRHRHDNHHHDNSRRGITPIPGALALFTASALLAERPVKDEGKSRELADHVMRGEVDIVRVRKLLKDGADPNYRYPGGWTLIHVGAARRNMQLVKMLLRFGCDVNSQDTYPQPVRSVYELEQYRAERLAMNGNYKVEVDWRGFTPLHYAVLNDDVAMVKVLTEHGASISSLTRTGFTPLDLQAPQATPDIAQLLTHLCETQKKEKILSLGPWLREKVVGQEAALAAVTSAVQRRDLGWQGEKPLVMLFVGSSGIGKTETAKQLAAHKNTSSSSPSSSSPSSSVSFIRIDMSEYQERHEVAKFIGSPPGYIGHEEGGQLTRALAKHPESVVLFDEVEKAHPDVLNIMLQLFDEGRLTDGKGTTIVCPNAIFIMTTNVGADSIAALGADSGELGADSIAALGADSGAGELGADSGKPVIDEEFKKHIMYPQFKRAFRRNEFLGRINEIVYFLPFSRTECVLLVEREMGRIQEYARKLGIEFSWSDEAAELLARSIDPNYGARSLKNEVARVVVNKMADLNLENKIKAGSNVCLEVRDGKVKFKITK